MANIKSARKRAAKSVEERAANRSARSRMRSAVKQARSAVESGAENAEALVADAVSIIDRSASKGVIHANTAARSKSRLVRAARKTDA